MRYSLDASTFADCTSLVATPVPFCVHHTSCVKTADFVTIIVLLEEEALTFSTIDNSVVALFIAVIHSLLVVVGCTIYWVSVANTIGAAIGQGDLRVGWAISHKVDRRITGTPNWNGSVVINSHRNPDRIFINSKEGATS